MQRLTMTREQARETIERAIAREATGTHVSLDYQLKLAKQIRSYREALGLALFSVAARLDVTVERLQEWEDGIAFPDNDQVERLARILAGDDDREALTDYWKDLTFEGVAVMLERGIEASVSRLYLGQEPETP